jgi:hypothetical protein
MASKSVAKQETYTPIPALANTPALDIGAEDVALPKLYKGEFQSGLVQDGVVPAGSLFTASGADDPEAEVLWDGEGDGVLAHVIGLRKGKSITVDGELVTYSFDDPDAPAEAWVTYQYVLCLPEADPSLPYKCLMTKTSSPTAKAINLLLKKEEGRGPTYGVAFRLTTKKREKSVGGQTYKWFIFQARKVEADPANVQLAENLAVMIAGAPSIERESTPSTQPAI